MSNDEEMIALADAAAATADRLTRLLVDETKVLNGDRRDELRALLAMTTATIGELESHVNALRERTKAGDAATVLGPRRRGELVRVGDRLKQVASEHERRLRAALIAHRRIASVISSAVSSLSANGTSYGKTGAMQRVRTPAPPAVALNRAL